MRLLIHFISEFSHVLQCTICLIRKLREKTWNGESADYASVTFDAIKDNTSFSNMLMDAGDAQDSIPWWLSWFGDYLTSLWSMPDFDEVLAKMVNFLCGEAQHERFEATRPVTMRVAVEVRIIFVTTAVDSLFSSYCAW